MNPSVNPAPDTRNKRRVLSARRVILLATTIASLGVGALIAEATATGNYTLLLGATLTLIVVVITINRLFWRRMYQVAEDKYRME